ncbi:ribosome small subunit-dependent GTPase A [Paenibacillus sp. N1-5-1-14]|uniref:ribosome small subunit-dependent GTPase A n=1 Tax=Paenibacillus radicibacter TaxID=2972488 RepID=UPI002158AE9F|nr:ribosome small subunit-dependent GTPase A [Paenibacillus radicibacter]MCR8644952.1 ribosome small subunit-dependent GTPase A [Paenibacillus radicibacter]
MITTLEEFELTNNTLETLGWSSFYNQSGESYIKEGFTFGRVALEHKHMYRLYTEQGDLLAEITGKLRHLADGREDYPAVGDWVAISARPLEGRASIHGILSRKSKFSRKVAGSIPDEQIVAANVDSIFLVNALNNDFNIRRLERYLILAWESGAQPVIILSKSDLCSDIDSKIAEVESVAIGVPILVISSLVDEGMDQLAPYLAQGQTVALLGSSGAGKSSIVNRLSGQTMMDVQEVREGDDRGRHTTTHRELVMLPNGGMIIDTPGMRELGLWDGESGIQEAFEDIETYAEQCRFSDCLHKNEPGCAIRAAIRDGSITQERYNSYLKLQKEIAFLERKTNRQARAAEKDRWKKITQSVKASKRKI